MTEKDAIALLVKSGCSPEVIEHCKTVAGHAKEIALKIQKCAQKKGEEINIDIEEVCTGGLLHDIGRSKSSGICHAVEGARIAIENGVSNKLVNIIERHIGAGIPSTEAVALGLPEKDYLPVSLEEKIVSHADNLVFGTRIGSIDELVENLRERRMDEKIIQRFIELNNAISAMMC